MTEDKKRKNNGKSVEDLYNKVQVDIAQDRVNFFAKIQKIPRTVLAVGLIMEVIMLVAQTWAISKNGSVVIWQVVSPIILISIISIMAQLVKSDMRKYKSLFEKSNIQIFQETYQSLRNSNFKYTVFIVTGHILLFCMTLYSVNYDRIRYNPVSYSYNTLMQSVDDEYYKETPNFETINELRKQAIQLIDSTNKLDPTMILTASQVEFLSLTLGFFLFLGIIIQLMSIFLDLGLGDYLAAEITKSEAANTTFKVEKILNKVQSDGDSSAKSGSAPPADSSSSTPPPKTEQQKWDEDLETFKKIVADHKKDPSNKNSKLRLMAGAISDYAKAINDTSLSKNSVLLSKAISANDDGINKHYGVLLYRAYEAFKDTYEKIRSDQNKGKLDMAKYEPLDAISGESLPEELKTLI